ncbi:cupin domain-containing protein [Streptomyces sp. NPDC090493]|uniref:cupin domain-containing protein n=1 Tax=Streptomyces sp. NPDC090493 TaxID=3365964 RepID=UPI0038127189
MEITYLSDARPYDAPGHQAMAALRLQGGEASRSRVLVGLSHFLPGGGAEWSASAVDRVYVVVEGEMTVEVQGGKHTLRPTDSCWIPAGESRGVRNETNLPASMLVIIDVC